MAKSGTGRAINTHAPFWHIVDSAGDVMVVFEHARFSFIVGGARVHYIDLDENGIADDVRSVAETERNVVEAVGTKARFGWGARKRLRTFLQTAAASGEPAATAAKTKLKEIATIAQSGDGVITRAILDEYGIGAD